MQCKEFFVVEKPQIFRNVDNDRSIIENICINNKLFLSNIIIYPLTSRLISTKLLSNMKNAYERNLYNTSITERPKEKNEKAFKDISSKTNSKKQKNSGSPTDQPSLIKKEVGERN